MKRRVLSVAVALCLMVGLSIPALATSEVSKEKGTVKTTLTAEISTTKLRVTVPTTIKYSIDPWQSVTTPPSGKTSATAQVTQPKVYITNYSPFDVCVGISGVSVIDVALTKKVSDLTSGNPYIFFDLYAPKNTSKTMPTLDYTKDLTYTYTMASLPSGKYYMINESDGIIEKTSTTSGNAVPLTICTRIDPSAGFVVGESFDIVPTFIVSANTMFLLENGVSVWG